MEEKSKVIFGNPIDDRTYHKALKKKAKLINKYGDDTKKEYHLKAVPLKQVEELNISNLVFADQAEELDKKGVVIGNIRMGFGHYRISLAIASCANALGYKPYWFDCASFRGSTGSEMIQEQNAMYSLASKISQKSYLFNKLVWEPLNSEGFRKITYNCGDQKNAELLAPLYHDLPKDMPFIATHVWPAQGAIHAGMTHVVNAIPDNWPMGLHLAEGAIHTVQTPFAYMGYKMLNGFSKKDLKHMPDDDLYQVGHYIDHELVSNVDKDCALREERIKENKPIRFLITVGGAGAGADMYLAMIKHLIPLVKQKKAAIYINFGDHLKMWDFMKKEIPGFEKECVTYFDQYEELKKAIKGDSLGSIVAVYNKDIFEAVYSTNILMRISDVLVTKPSELSFYPIPKLFMKHIGGHERYGAFYAQEIGDATWECDTKEKLTKMIDTLVNDKRILLEMVRRIVSLKNAKFYDGGYEVVKLAVNGRK